ncbi:hypothetical protein M758_8G155400 [Ceratodon purpureus]|uniref:Secreted protein n=1 Tax=Ceratodon purpureus TaxID=3225 RepID=A0A8T0H2P2_CERPU|nr:hypothetical protein KC19_8G159000 [Ceratodon purpureus]KAG0609074.1 hypothetical protein M758_8G155400 [Ceratodon purpureus]
MQRWGGTGLWLMALARACAEALGEFMEPCCRLGRLHRKLYEVPPLITIAPWPALSPPLMSLRAADETQMIAVRDFIDLPNALSLSLLQGASESPAASLCVRCHISHCCCNSFELRVEFLGIREISEEFSVSNSGPPCPTHITSGCSAILVLLSDGVA